MVDSRKRFLREILALVAVVALILVFAVRRKDGAASSVDEHRLMMGTIVSVTVFSPDGEASARAIEAAFDEIARVEALTTRYSPESEISRINSLEGERAGAIPVNPEVVRVVRTSLAISELSGGAFDVTVAPLVDLWQFEEDGVIPSQEAIEAVLPLIDYTRVHADAHGASLTLPSGIRVDLDAIAKGYAVDRAVAVLEEQGVESAIVDAGGDVGLLGAPPRAEGWRVGVKHPRSGGLLGVLTLDGGAVATSGDYQRYTTVEGRRFHHILDPSTGYPASGVVSVTVSAETAVDADGLATAVFVMGSERGMGLVEKLPGVEAVIVTGEEEIGEILVSSGLRGQFSANE